MVTALFCAWRPTEALRPRAAGFRILLLCPLNKHTQGLHPGESQPKRHSLPVRQRRLHANLMNPVASPEPLGWDEKRQEGREQQRVRERFRQARKKKNKRTGNFAKPRSSPGCLFQSATEGVPVNYRCASSTGQNVLGMVPRPAGLRNHSSASSSLPKAKVEE